MMLKDYLTLFTLLQILIQLAQLLVGLLALKLKLLLLPSRSDKTRTKPPFKCQVVGCVVQLHYKLKGSNIKLGL